MQAAKNAFENTKNAAGKAVDAVKPSSSSHSNTRSGMTSDSGIHSANTQNYRGGSRQQNDSLIRDDSEDLTSRHREYKDVAPSRGSSTITTDSHHHNNAHVGNPTVKTRETQVQELMNPAVVHEKVLPSEVHQTSKHVEREVHQDHFQTRIQPIQDKTVLPTQTETRNLPTEYRESTHGREHNREIDAQLAAEHSQFQSSKTVAPTVQTSQQGDVTVEEHRHHHVHEIVQPVLEREVIAPKIIHVNQNIHEKVEKEPTFHPKTVQPTMTLEEFQRCGGSLDHTNRVTNTTKVFQGEPQIIENGGANVKYPCSSKDASGACTHTGPHRTYSSSSDSS